MKHYKIANKYRFTAFVLIVLIIFSLAVSAMFNRVSARSNQKYISVSISEGDTLWDIAKEYGNSKKDIRRVVYDICKTNNMAADDLRPGQIILVPED